MARKLPTGPQEVVRVPAGPYPTPPHQYSQEEKMVHMAVLVLSLAILWSLGTSLLRRMLGHGQEVHPTPWRVNVLLLTSEPAELPDILNRTLIAWPAVSAGEGALGVHSRVRSVRLAKPFPPCTVPNLQCQACPGACALGAPGAS